MANIFTQNPLILDTAWTNSTIPAALTTANGAPQNFSRILWVGPSAPADTVVITDINGNVIVSAECAVADQQVVLWDSGAARRNLLLKYGQWILSHISSGKLYLWK